MGKKIRRDAQGSKFFDANIKLEQFPKTKEDEEIILKALRANDFITALLPKDKLKNIVDVMYPVKAKKKELITIQGQTGVCMYVSKEGTYEVQIDNKQIASFADSRVFGELAILFNQPRKATIIARSKCYLWALDREVFNIVQTNIQKENEALTVLILKQVPRIKSLPDEKIKLVASLVKKSFYNAGAIIVKEGDPANQFYIIASGNAVVITKNDGQVATLTKGSFFGETALINATARNATVQAIDVGVMCYSLTSDDFKNYLADWFSSTKITEDIFEVDDGRERHSFPDDVNDYRVTALLGIGGFGQVYLAKYRSRKYAMKAMSKYYLSSRKMKHNAYNEKLSMDFRSPFLVSMFRTYQDGKYLYFILEACLGGDLWALQHSRPKNQFPNNHVVFYAASVLEALNYIHQKGYVYIDLKPENVLIDKKGYAKLGDFGGLMNFADAQRSIIEFGTAEYLAPEVLKRQGYGIHVDYWTLGILIFDLLTGKTPFYNSNDSIQVKSILKGIESVKFPDEVSNSAKSIITGLLNQNKVRRLGCSGKGAQEVKQHAWFRDFSFDALRNRSLQPPFVPTSQDVENLKHFGKMPAVPHIPNRIFPDWPNF